MVIVFLHFIQRSGGVLLQSIQRGSNVLLQSIFVIPRAGGVPITAFSQHFTQLARLCQLVHSRPSSWHLLATNKDCRNLWRDRRLTTHNKCTVHNTCLKPVTPCTAFIIIFPEAPSLFTSYVWYCVLGAQTFKLHNLY